MRNGWQALCFTQNQESHATVRASNFTHHQEPTMLTEAIVVAPPVLAAGWSLLYLLFGGGLGGAVLIFFGLKLIGR
jgi:hypothetical protein